jgi:r-opsin
LSTIWGSLFAKANAVYNPIVYGISHPKYRVALLKRYPALGCASAQAPPDNQSQNTTVQSETISEKA